jgi:hypothetical protein
MLPESTPNSSTCSGRPPPVSDLLTPDEHRFVALLTTAAGLVPGIVAPGDPEQAATDAERILGPLAAARSHVLAQAAARAYPAEYRLLGVRHGAMPPPALPAAAPGGAGEFVVTSTPAALIEHGSTGQAFALVEDDKGAYLARPCLCGTAVSVAVEEERVGERRRALVAEAAWDRHLADALARGETIVETTQRNLT